MTKFDEGKFDGQEANQEAIKVTDEQVQAILQMCPVVANKFFVAMVDGQVKLIFAEESMDRKYTVMRSSIVMSVNAFLTMMNMLVPQAQQIKLAMQNQQKAQNISENRSPVKENLN